MVLTTAPYRPYYISPGSLRNYEALMTSGNAKDKLVYSSAAVLAKQGYRGLAYINEEGLIMYRNSGGGLLPGGAAKIVASGGSSFAPPRLPHPDASDMSKGPNLGGEDALIDRPGSQGTGPTSSGVGLLPVLLIGGAIALLVMRRKK